jgi:hypothetical protein
MHFTSTPHTAFRPDLFQQSCCKSQNNRDSENSLYSDTKCSFTIFAVLANPSIDPPSQAAYSLNMSQVAVS